MTHNSIMQSSATINAESKTQTGSASLVLLFIICFAGSMFGGVAATLMSVYLPQVVNEFKSNQTDIRVNDISGYINSLFILGWAIGGFLWGLIGDKTGRKAALLLSIASFGFFTLLTGLTQSWVQVMICRFLSGFGVGGVLVVSFTLISEVWPERSRSVYTGILSISFPIGIFSAGLINYYVTSWRQGFLIGFLPALIAGAGYWLIAESALWRKHHPGIYNAHNTPDHLFSGSNRPALVVGSVIFGTMLIGLWAIFSWLPTWIQSLSAAGVRQKGGVSMMFMGMGGLIGGFGSGWLVNFIGLRKSLITCFAVCSVLSFILFKTNSSFSAIIYVEIAVLALFFGASQGILSIYIPQLFPIAIRASATGFCFNIGRLFTAAAVLFIGVLVIFLGGYSNSLFIFSSVFLIGLFTVLLVKNINPQNQLKEDDSYQLSKN